MHARSLPVGTLAVAAALTAIAMPGAPAGAASARAGARPACSTRGLVAWLDTQGSGAAGSIYYRLEFTNLSGHACTFSGYPRVAAISLSGRQLGAASGRFVSRTPSFALANRGTASAVLQIVDVGNFPASVCHPVTAAGLRVFPPHQAASRVVPFPFRACARSGPQYLFAQAVRPHA